jgi:hypothetical protein
MDFLLAKVEYTINNVQVIVRVWLIWLLAIVVAFLLTKLVIAVIKLQGRKRNTNQIMFLVRLPKERPEDKNTNFNLEQMHEEIAKGENLFASIGGLKPKKVFFSRNDNFSFEIVANQKRVAFFVCSPEENARYIEQKIHAHYPDALVEEVPDYNIFHPSCQVIGAYVKTARDYIFPIKSYKDSDIDAFNSVINVMSKLEKNEAMVIQYLVRSSNGGWHSRVKKITSQINKKQSFKEGYRASNSIFKFLSVFGEALKKSNGNKLDDQDLKKLTATEEEALKAIEHKNTKAGLDVNIRIIISSLDKTRSNVYLNNILTAFNEFNNYEYGNRFTHPIKSRQKSLINDFIYRRFQEKRAFLLNTEELATIYHFPTRSAETPNILWLTAKEAPAPSNLPTEGVSLGYNTYRGVKKEVRMKREDRRRHVYIIGKSGVGKSVLQTNMIIQDIYNGEGVCVMDPHGDLIQDILEKIPPERAEDVVIFSPADLERPLGLNLLEYDSRYPEQKSFVINEMINIFDKLYDLRTTGGPMFEQYMRNAMLLIMDDPETGSTLLEISRVLADPEFRKLKLSRCKNQTVADFWQKEAEKAGGEAALANMVPYITSKLTQFISNDMMRPIISQQNSSFNIRQIMDEQKILLVDLPKGLIGETNAYLLGMIMVGKILMAALSRADQGKERRKDFYLYIDEFQNFTTASVCQILSESRKYGLGLIIAHQYVGQLTPKENHEIKDAVFGNVGTIVSFKVGAEDAEFLTKEFEPVFNEYDLINAGKGVAYIKLLIDNENSRPFSLHTIWPIIGQAKKEMPEKIRALSRIKFGRDKSVIESELQRRRKLT